MGDRANVVVLGTGPSPVYLYTHWGGSELPATLQAALKRGEGRWTDPSYLARIIFCEMVAGREQSELGYGISTAITDNSYPLLVVNPVAPGGIVAMVREENRDCHRTPHGGVPLVVRWVRCARRAGMARVSARRITMQTQERAGITHTAGKPYGLDALYDLTSTNTWRDGDIVHRTRPWKSLAGEFATFEAARQTADHICTRDNAAVHVWHNGDIVYHAYPDGFTLPIPGTIDAGGRSR